MRLQRRVVEPPARQSGEPRDDLGGLPARHPRVDEDADRVHRLRLVPRPPTPDPAWSGNAPDPATSLAPWHIYNIGNSQPVEVTEVVRLIEEAVGKPAVRQLLPMQPGDVPQTWADGY